MLTKFRRLADLSPGELLLISQLTVLALAVGVGLRLAALPDLTGFLVRAARHPWLGRLPWRHERHDPARLAVLADLAARLTRGRGRCLTRSLLLYWLLAARGAPVELRVGITKHAALLQGHAWIETAAGVIGDSAELTGRFVVLVRL